MTPEALAQIAYETFCRNMRAGESFSPWSLLTPESKKVWIAVAQAVKANVLSGFTKVGEMEWP